MELKEFLNEYDYGVMARQGSESARFKNLKTGEFFVHNNEIPSKNFLIECCSETARHDFSLAHIVPKTMRATSQNTSSSTSSSSGGVRAFNDADIAEFNDWASRDDSSPVKKIVRKAPDFLLFVLRHPVHWKRVYASLDEDRSHPKLFDAVFDGPKGIRKDKEHTMRSIGIQISTKSNAKLEQMGFVTRAYWDEDGQHGLRHPNVSADNNRVCMGSLEGSARLGLIHISDIITLMEGVNMTSAYNNNRDFYNNQGDQFIFRPGSSLYGRKEMFKEHKYLG